MEMVGMHTFGVNRHAVESMRVWRSHSWPRFLGMIDEQDIGNRRI